MIQIEGIYQANYLHILSAIMDDLKLTQQMDRLVHSDPQCKTTPGEVVKLSVLERSTGDGHVVCGKPDLYRRGSVHSTSEEESFPICVSHDTPNGVV